MREQQPAFRPATLEDMLEAREKRAFFQRRLLSEYGATVISFTLNLAGPRKTSALAERAFQEGCRLISERLKQAGIPFRLRKTLSEHTGPCAFFTAGARGEDVKAQTSLIEETCPIGRLFDIDVLLPDGRKVSRKDIGLAERRCLLCDKPAAVCARSRAHSVEDLEQTANRMILRYFREKDADWIAREAGRAMLYEVSVTPKPGLVDRQHSGSHRDMDFFTFLDSTTALIPFFRRIALLGLKGGEPPEDLLRKSRYLGRRAEDAMFSATGGVNTQKGLIFSMGLMCLSAGYLKGRRKAFGETDLLQLCSSLAGSTLHELTEGRRTYGERQYAQYGLTGVRGESANGFPNVRKIALPVLRKAAGQGESLNDAGAVALLHLIARVDDTNLIARSSFRTQKEIQTRLRAYLAQKHSVREQLEKLRELDAEFQRGQISCGGCADLLALAYLLFFLFPAKEGPAREAAAAP